MLQSKDPYRNELIREYPEDSSTQVQEKLSAASSAQKRWMSTPLTERAALARAIAATLDSRKESLATMMAREMGKPITQGRAEVEKCAWLCRHYAESAAEYLEPERIAIDGQDTSVYNQPLGTVLGIMPWNYPFWQVFRFIIPTMLAGNTTLLKHASNVTGCAMLIKDICADAGVPEGVFQVLVVPGKQMNTILGHDAISAVTLTGSEPAGSAAAEAAGRHIRPSLLELGGSNAFIVCADADVDRAVEAFVQGRYQNTGQSCIAAKRLILEDRIADHFTHELLKQVGEMTYGDPLEESSKMGPLARIDLAEELESQMERSIAKGARLLHGGQRDGACFEATVIENVAPGQPAFDDETFGPLAAITRCGGFDEAVELCGQSRFGLGVSIFTTDHERVMQRLGAFNEGAVFVNDFVKSDPRVPFGGVKASGYGRELGRDGILSFVNRQTVVVRG